MKHVNLMQHSDHGKRISDSLHMVHNTYYLKIWIITIKTEKHIYVPNKQDNNLPIFCSILYDQEVCFDIFIIAAEHSLQFRVNFVE